MPKPETVWFYVATEEAVPILQKIFATGIRPGGVLTIPAEDLEILQKGMIYLPATMIDKSMIERPTLVVPQAS